MSMYLNKKYYSYLSNILLINMDLRKNASGGMYIPEFKISISKRVSNNLSVYTAEILAAIIGLQWVEEVR